MGDVRQVLEYYGVDNTENSKVNCPIHGEKTPSFTIYEEGGVESWFCFGCNASGKGQDALGLVRHLEPDMSFKECVSRLEEILDRKVELGSGEEKKRTVVVTENPELPITVLREIAATTVYQNVGYRGISKETDEYFKVRSVVEDGQVTKRYYPETNNDGKITGMKCRNHPKSFTHGKIGCTGIKSQLSGQFKCKGGGKYILIVGGEEDLLASHQMFVEYQRSRGQGDLKACDTVSPTSGEGSAAKQVAAQYDFLDQYDNIVIGMDNDKAGLKATEEIVKVLPKEKVKIVKWSNKDPSDMLQAGLGKQFIRDFYNAREVVSSGIKSSASIIDDVEEVLTAQKITLPPYMHRMETMMKRAFSKNGRVSIVAGATSSGKSTHVNNMIYHWIFSEGLKPLVISLEMTGGEYAVDLLSLHLKKNLDWFEDGQDALNYLERDDVKELYEDLFTDEYGEERFRIVDDRDGKIETLMDQIERGVKQYGCNIVIIDVLTDVLRFLPMDEQEKHMAWQKNFVKTGVSIVNVMHTRKPERDKDGKLKKITEFDILGSSTFSQSAHITMLINRDKMAADDIEKNTTYVDMPKCRRGTTGEAGAWYYDPETRQVHDRDDYFNNNLKVDTNDRAPSKVGGNPEF